MVIRLGLFLLLVASAVVAESKLLGENVWDIGHLSHGRGLVGDFINPKEEMMMGSESARRTLEETRYVSYDALRADNVPCDKRGSSYYNCDQHGNANPYERGCTYITRCARHTD